MIIDSFDLPLRELDKFLLFISHHSCDEGFFKKFWRDLQGKKEDFKITLFPTSIGPYYEVECLRCKIKKDITDYDSW